MSKQPAILDLTDLAPQRPQVKMRDGNLYEIRTLSDMSPVEWAQWNAIGDQERTDGETETPEAAKVNTEKMRERAGLILIDAPSEVLADLTWLEGSRIVHFFMERLDQANGWPADVERILGIGRRIREAREKAQVEAADQSTGAK